MGAQAKVLRVLQEGEVERVGGNETITVDVRVIAATNKDLKSEIGKARFRADLYDRLNVVPIEVPPLREHKEDVPSLVEHFLAEACAANGKRKLAVAGPAMSLLMQHDWPGNVRELRNHVERMVIFSRAEPAATSSARTTCRRRSPASSRCAPATSAARRSRTW